MGVKGYKVFAPDWTCRGVKFEVGKTYKHEGEIIPFTTGFHFLKRIVDCLEYYYFDPKNKIAEVEAIGKIVNDNSKSFTDEIKILREVSWNQMLGEAR